MAFEELKARQSAMWGAGPFERVADTIRDVHQVVIERADPRPGEQLLDAATGTGAVAFLAAERGADVVGMDFAPVLVETARGLAAEHGVDARFDVGDAEAMPYENGRFDVVTSTCGVMFAPDQAAVAGELARVTRPGGRIALACWTPDGGIGEMFAMMRPFVPPPAPGAGIPFDWGRREHVHDLLGDAFELDFEEEVSVYRTESGAVYWDLFSTSYGPTKVAADALDPERREEFREAWIEFYEARREGDQIVDRREYLLTLGTRR